MAKKGKAAVLVAPEKIEIEEFALPPIGADDGLLRVEATGVCGADWPLYRKEPGTWATLPLILGHEIVGRVERLGADAAKRWKLKEGDRVVIEEYVPCGHCNPCLSGHYARCQERRMYGFTSLNMAPGLWGGYSEYVYLHPHSLVHRIADSVPSKIAPLYLPLSNGIRWTQVVGEVKIGSSVVILGPGNQGLGCVVAAKEAGAASIIIAGRSNDAGRLEVAKALGADHAINVDTENVIDRVREITDGAMADTVINVTAHAPKATQLAVDLAAQWGTVVMAGMANGAAENYMPDVMTRKELTIKGVLGRTTRELKHALKLLESGKYPFEKQCTHRYSIEETEKAIKTVGRQGDPGAIHVAVVNS
jgi:threonine dehydrogenase-like Zn-dependent dehydrogenase